MAACGKVDFMLFPNKPPTEDRFIVSVPVEERAKRYAPRSLNTWHYAENAPYVINRGGTYSKSTVKFWTTPVFDSMWYTRCGEDSETALWFATHYTKPTLYKESVYSTGIFGLDASEKAGLKCYGGNCGTKAGRAVFGRIVVPEPTPLMRGGMSRVNKVGSWDVVDLVQYEFDVSPSNWYHTLNDVESIISQTYTGGTTAAYIPRSVAVFMLEMWALSTNRNGQYLMFAEPKSAMLIKEFDGPLYSFLLDSLCTGANLKNEMCMVFCKETSRDCDSRLETFCKSIGSHKALDKEHSDLCGCFMGNQFYKGYFDTLREKFNFPVTAPPSHVCYFDFCVNSNNKPYAEKQNPVRCPDVMNCFQNVDVTISSGGKLETGDVIVTATQDCLSKVKRKCVTQDDCKTVPRSKCSEGICKIADAMPVPDDDPDLPTSGAQCQTDANCGHWQLCVNKKCEHIKGQCLTDAQCVGGGTCVENKCIEKPARLHFDTYLLIAAVVIAIGTVL